MDRSLDYYFQCYLHQGWDHECGSDDIRQSLAFFFKNECGDDPLAKRKLASRLILEIDEVLAASDEKVMAQIALSYFWFPTAVEARSWLWQLKDWCLAYRARV